MGACQSSIKKQEVNRNSVAVQLGQQDHDVKNFFKLSKNKTMITNESDNKVQNSSQINNLRSPYNMKIIESHIFYSNFQNKQIINRQKSILPNQNNSEQTKVTSQTIKQKCLPHFQSSQIYIDQQPYNQLPMDKSPQIQITKKNPCNIPIQKKTSNSKRKRKSNVIQEKSCYPLVMTPKKITSLPINRSQPKSLNQFFSNDLDLRQTFIPDKTVKTQLPLQKRYEVGLSVISQGNAKSQLNSNKNSSIIDQGNTLDRKFGPKITRGSQIEAKNDNQQQPCL